MLNKIGVIVLVIGLALFLGYSFRYFGPPGRAAIGLAASVGLLVTGVLLERLARYGMYGRGLIGGGWAALYFTLFFCLPLLGLCFLADLVFYLLFTRVFDSCYGLLCVLQ